MQWQHTLNLSDLWSRQEKPETKQSAHLIAKEIATRIRKASFYGEYEDQVTLEAICKRFEGLYDECEALVRILDADVEEGKTGREAFDQEDLSTVTEEFDQILAYLYNWCDRDKRVWVKTVH